jgi:general secretion pathway protein C
MDVHINYTDFNALINFDRQRLLAAANSRLPNWATFILVIAIAWQCAHIVWMLVPGSPIGDTIDAMPAQSSMGSNSAQSDRANVQAIAATHLFGEANADALPIVPQAPVDDLAETALALTLKGIMASSGDTLSIAIIADNRDEEKIYSIGDTVAAGATLHAVYAEQVVLNRNGTLEALKLPKDFPKTAAPARRSQTGVQRSTTASPTSNARSIQNVVAQNVTKLADVIRPTPYFVGGQQQGYRVYPGRDRKKFAALGLRPGDLIKDIDGAALTDPQQAMQIFENLGSTDQVSVTVERNGQPQVLVLSTSQLNLDNEQ